jgi:hypothetical protein
MTVNQNLGSTGNAPIIKVGHTNSGVFGSEPMAKTKGRDGKPAEQTFGGSSK